MRFGRVALLAGALVVAACGGDGDASPDASPTTTAARQTTTSSTFTTTTTSVSDVEATLIEVYERSWQDYARASNPPDPDVGYLAERHTGAALDAIRNQLRTFVAEGIELRGEHRANAEVLEVDETTARLRDCGIDGFQVVIPETGAVVSDSGGAEIGAYIDMVLEDGNWKVATYELDQGACS